MCVLLAAVLLAAGIFLLAFPGPCGIQATHLHGLPGDPANRVIVETALRQSAALVPGHERLLAWNGTLQSVDARV